MTRKNPVHQKQPKGVLDLAFCFRSHIAPHNMADDTASTETITPTSPTPVQTPPTFIPTTITPSTNAPTTLKLFVGQVPKHVFEDELRKIFEPCGTITDITVLRDHATGEHRGTLIN